MGGIRPMLLVLALGIGLCTEAFVGPALRPGVLQGRQCACPCVTGAHHGPALSSAPRIAAGLLVLRASRKDQSGPGGDGREGFKKGRDKWNSPTFERASQARGFGKDLSTAGRWQGQGGQGGQPLPATRQQIRLNQELASLSLPEDVLDVVQQAREEGLELNIVNLSTALSKLAKAQRGSPGRLGGREVYQWIMWSVSDALEQTKGAVDPRSLASLAWSLANMRDRGSAGVLTDVLQRVMDSDLGAMRAQGMSTVAWACAKRAGDLDPKLVEGVMEAVSDEVDARGSSAVSSPQDVSNLVWAFARTKHYSSGLIELVEGWANAGVRQWNEQSVSNVMWGLAKMGVSRCRATEVLCEEAGSRGLGAFKSQELSNLVWGVTVCHKALPPALAEGVEEWLSSHAFERPQHQTVTLWSFAKSGLRSPVLFRSAEESVVGSLSGLVDYSPQAMSNLVWSFATTQTHAPALFAAVEDEICERRLDDFKPQEVANVAWAFSKAGMDGGGGVATAGVLWECMEEAMLYRDPQTFEGSHLAIIAWACARRARALMTPPGQFPRSPSMGGGAQGGRDASLVTVMSVTARELRSRGLESLQPQELSILAWAYSTAGGLMGAQILSALVSEVLQRDLFFFDARALTNIAWAYAHHLQGPNNMVAALFARIDEEVMRRGVGGLKIAEASVIAWAFAKTGQRDGEVLPAVHDKMLLEASLDGYSGQNLVMCLWALVVAGVSSPALLDRVQAEMLARGLDSFKAREINAAVFALSTAKHTSQELWDAIDAEAGERARGAREGGQGMEPGETLRDYSLDAVHDAGFDAM